MPWFRKIVDSRIQRLERSAIEDTVMADNAVLRSFGIGATSAIFPAQIDLVTVRQVVVEKNGQVIKARGAVSAALGLASQLRGLAGEHPADRHFN